MCVECTGEGIVLVEPAAEPPRSAAAPAADRAGAGRSAPRSVAAASDRRHLGRTSDRPPGDWDGDSPGDWHGDVADALPVPPSRRSARRAVTMSLASLSPLDAAARLAGRRGRVLLHAARDDDGLGRCSFAAAEPRPR